MSKHKIMIVDDDRMSLKMSEHILSGKYETVCANCGREAIELYKTEHPDLIISALKMPEIDGFTLQRMLEEHEGRPIPFMFMTEDKTDEAESKGFAIDALDFIRKPFRADVLLTRVSNILSAIEQMQGINENAMTDPMTGLLNRESAQKEIDSLVKNSSGALMMINLDNFKAVNDTYGNDMGDKLLISFAEVIRSAIRSTDLAGRMSGDEFIVFCKNILSESVIAKKAAYINDQILQAAKELMGPDMSIPLGASIGCVFAPDEGKDFLTLFKKADKALFDVQRDGLHSYRIFRSISMSVSSNSFAPTALSNTMLLLAEQSPLNGALAITPDNFKAVYQFLYRVVLNYHKKIHVMLYTLTPESDDADIDAAMEALTDVIKNALRQSDVITQNGDNQILIILLHAIPSDIDIVTERIKTNWSDTDLSRHFSIDYEIDMIR